MLLSIEAFIGMNLLMNLTVLGLSARFTGHIHWMRVLAAAMIGTAYASVAYGALPALKGTGGQIACMTAMALILFVGRRRKLKGLLLMMGSTAFAGGVMQLLAQRLIGRPFLSWFGWLIVLCAALVMEEVRGRSCGSDQIRLRIETRMGKTEVDALIDTGNRLREPMSGLPVIIVGSRSLTGVLDASCLNQGSGRLPPGFRLIHYGALGGCGEMRCFRPESVCIYERKGWQAGPDVWIAIYPDELPSRIEALAPPVFGRMRMV